MTLLDQMPVLWDSSMLSSFCIAPPPQDFHNYWPRMVEATRHGEGWLAVWERTRMPRLIDGQMASEIKALAYKDLEKENGC